MIPKRFGEEADPPFRSQRLFAENGQWYFDTREGRQIGPYHDRTQAKFALAVFLAQRLLIVNMAGHVEDSYVPGAQDGIEDMVDELFGYYSTYKSQGQTGAAVWSNQRIRELIRSGEDFSGSNRIRAIQYALELESEFP